MVPTLIMCAVCAVDTTHHRAMSQAVTLKLKIEKELDVRSLDAGAAGSEDSATAPTAPVGDESTNGGGKAADHQHANQGGKGRGSMDKEESKLLLRCVPSRARDVS